jgi:hypothetical protein
MKPLEDELREALRREEPPPDLVERVLTRVRQLGQVSRSAPLRITSREAAKMRVWSRLPSWLWQPQVRWALATVACCLLIAGVVVAHQRAQRAKAEAAREQLEVALQLASGKLNRALREVRRVERIESGTPARRDPARRTERL